MFLKSNGTQKWGKGFKETQRGIQILSLPISSIFNLKMPELTNAYHGISDLRISQDNYSSILETSITIG